MSRARPRECGECASALADDQRYCLSCGERAGARSPHLLGLLAGIGAPPAEAGANGGETPPASPTGPAARATLPRLPGPRVSAALVLLFAAFGVLLGAVGGSRVDDTLAASSGAPLKVVLGARAAATAPPAAPEGEPETGGGAEPAGGEEAAATPPASPQAAEPTSTATRPSSGSAGQGEGESRSAAGARPFKLSAIKHVFVIMLSQEPYASVFGPLSPARYLSGTLEHRGALLVRYDAVAHEQLANGLALISGQGPTAETAANCPTYTDVSPTGTAAYQQVLGSGCVYPAATKTLPDQLSARHLRWRAYVEGIDEAPGQAPACAHPVPGQPDPTAAPAPEVGPSGAPAASLSGPYATFRNPFVYFHSLLDSPACASGDVGLWRLQADLASPARTPSFAYVVPGRCDDGAPTPCAPGAPAGMVPADATLRRVVGQITRSRAYRESGLIVITVDEAPTSGEFADSSSCCGQPPFPNVSATGAGPVGHGGGTVGALLLSPFIKGAQTSQEPYSHFSLLRTIENVFGLAHLGYAGLPGVKPFESSLFAQPARH